MTKLTLSKFKICTGIRRRTDSEGLIWRDKGVRLGIFGSATPIYRKIFYDQGSDRKNFDSFSIKRWRPDIGLGASIRASNEWRHEDGIPSSHRDDDTENDTGLVWSFWTDLTYLESEILVSISI